MVFDNDSEFSNFFPFFFLSPFCLMTFKDWADAKLPEKGLFSCLSVIPKVLLAGAITLMDEAYFKLAVWLNDRGWFFFRPIFFSNSFRLPIRKAISPSLHLHINDRILIAFYSFFHL